MNPTPLARSILARAGRPIPRYGSAEWDALPEHDLRRVAAVIIAAECWRDHVSLARVAWDLMEAQRIDDAMVLARMRGASADVQAGIRDACGAGWWKSPLHAELAERRAS